MNFPHLKHYTKHLKHLKHHTKKKYSINDFFGKRDQIRRKLDLVTFTEEILKGKIHFLQCKYPVTTHWQK